MDVINHSLNTLVSKIIEFDIIKFDYKGEGVFKKQLAFPISDVNRRFQNLNYDIN